MDFSGRQAGRRLAFEQILVIGVAVRQLPHAGVVIGLQRLERCHLGIERRVDGFFDNRGGARRRIGQAELFGAVGDRGDELAVSYRHGTQLRLLAERVGIDEGRRDDALAGIGGDAAGFFGQRRRDLFEPAEIGLQPGGVFNAVIGIKEFGGLLVGAVLLADDIGDAAAGAGKAEIEPGAFGRDAQRPLRRIIIVDVGTLQPVARDGIEQALGGGLGAAILGFAGGRNVGQLAGQRGVAAGIHAEQRRRFGAALEQPVGNRRQRGGERGVAPGYGARHHRFGRGKRRRRHGSQRRYGGGVAEQGAARHRKREHG